MLQCNYCTIGLYSRCDTIDSMIKEEFRVVGMVHTPQEAEEVHLISIVAKLSIRIQEL